MNVQRDTFQDLDVGSDSIQPRPSKKVSKAVTTLVVVAAVIVVVSQSLIYIFTFYHFAALIFSQFLLSKCHNTTTFFKPERATSFT